MHDDIRILFQDDWILAVHKPSGMPTQPSPGGPADLLTLLQAEHDYVGLLHRLDQPTSGIVLFSARPEANKPLSHSLQAHEWRKTYRAVLAGRPTTDAWHAPVGGRKATSLVDVLGRANGLVAAELTPVTGRTHQLRQHAAGDGCPIVGDRRYGGESGSWHPRLALHAYRLQLQHPHTTEPLTIEAPLPPDLQPLWKLAGGT